MGLTLRINMENGVLKHNPCSSLVDDDDDNNNNNKKQGCFNGLWFSESHYWPIIIVSLSTPSLPPRSLTLSLALCSLGRSLALSHHAYHAATGTQSLSYSLSLLVQQQQCHWQVSMAYLLALTSHWHSAIIVTTGTLIITQRLYYCDSATLTTTRVSLSLSPVSKHENMLTGTLLTDSAPPRQKLPSQAAKFGKATPEELATILGVDANYVSKHNKRYFRSSMAAPTLLLLTKSGENGAQAFGGSELGRGDFAPPRARLLRRDQARRLRGALV
jgi:hypothetical protein